MPKVSIGQYAKQNERLVKSIKKGMIDKDMQPDRLCEMIGSISRTTHFRYMNNPENMTLSTLRKYIRSLNLPPEDVLVSLGYQEAGR